MTIKALAELLMPKPAKANAVWYEPKFPQSEYKEMPREIAEWPVKISKWKCDICVALDVKGRRIGLNSAGDYPDVIEKNLKFLAEKEKCKIIFCTSRSKGYTADTVKEMAEKLGYNLMLTAPYSFDATSKWNAALKKARLEEFQEIMNMNQAEHLEGLIQAVPIA